MQLERIEKLINHATDSTTKCFVSRWERDFIDSIHRQVKNKRSLSPKQLNLLHKIESKIEKSLKGDPEWADAWDEEKARDWKTAVNYYDKGFPRYYGDILDWALANPNKIPPSGWYQKVVENKYAQKIIKALREEPKYSSGSTVMMRANARAGLSWYDWQALKDIPLFVVEPTDRAVSAAKGCRIYKVLSSVAMKTYEVEERFIKKWKQPKAAKTPKKSNTSSCHDIPF